MMFLREEMETTTILVPNEGLLQKIERFLNQGYSRSGALRASGIDPRWFEVWRLVSEMGNEKAMSVVNRIELASEPKCS